MTGTGALTQTLHAPSKRDLANQTELGSGDRRNLGTFQASTTLHLTALHTTPILPTPQWQGRARTLPRRRTTQHIADQGGREARLEFVKTAAQEACTVECVLLTYMAQTDCC